MLVSEKFYTAMAFLKSLSKDFPYYESVYRQTAYALNDPREKCAIARTYYSLESAVAGIKLQNSEVYMKKKSC